MEGLFKKVKDCVTRYLTWGGILKGKQVLIKNHFKNRFGGNFYFELQHGKITLVTISMRGVILLYRVRWW